MWKGIIQPESSWFTVNYQKAAETLQDVFKKYSRYFSNSKKSVKEIEIKWSYESMSKKFDEMLTQYLPKFAEKVELKLPTLKKIG